MAARLRSPGRPIPASRDCCLVSCPQCTWKPASNTEPGDWTPRRHASRHPGTILQGARDLSQVCGARTRAEYPARRGCWQQSARCGGCGCGDEIRCRARHSAGRYHSVRRCGSAVRSRGYFVCGCAAKRGGGGNRLARRMAAGEQLIPERICRAARSDHTSELPVMTMNPGLRRFTFTTHVTSFRWLVRRGHCVPRLGSRRIDEAAPDGQ
jgi:hypothetical protein